jgi:hypothetical protein
MDQPDTQSAGLTPLLYILVAVLYVVGARLIVLLREKHPQIWRQLGEPAAFAVWLVIPYCMAGEFGSLTDRSTRLAAQTERVVIWCAVFAAIGHFVLVALARL